ncbi:glycosyltransferase [Domibacillus sp.]|uniref:tetratricopeptide repeat-containing glycosyltransferase family 2 protein n=1 Tax=Domibacillus sp. TaxID=1969783 RepID=UPI0028113446|nr:glycosyltransferase [Domibacillus sp.]
MNPFISLCMIVKNEEKVIERCLSSITHLVDEVIIVDTGSTDKTKAISEKYTSKIFNFEWVDDFSAARNFAASKASGKWLLVLDADEYVDEENFKGFIQELKEDKGQFDAYTAKILNFTGNFGESLVQNLHDRIYKNTGEILYYRKIHEQFKHVEGKSLNIKNSSLLLFHSGYLNKTVNEKQKSIRNKELLQKEINVGPNKAFDYFNYGNEYASTGDYAKALECYLEAYKGKSDFRLSWVSTTLIQIIVCLMQLKRYNDALSVIKDAESIYDSSAEILFLKGEIFFLRGQLEDAKQAFKKIVNNQPKYNHIILRPDLKDQKPHTRLAEIYLCEENYNDAIFHYTSVLNINKFNNECIKKVIYILSKFHSSEEIAGFLFSKELVNSKNIKNYVRACFEAGNPQLALNLLENFYEENKFLYQIALLKKACITSEENFEYMHDILEYSIVKELIQANWINLIDLFLLREFSEKDNKVLSLIKQFEKEEVFNALINLFKVKVPKDDIEENLFLFSLQTLIDYRKNALCQVLLSKVDYLDKKSVRKAAALLFSKGYKVEALQLYEKTEWSYFNEQDFVNIINSMLQTNNAVNAVEVAKYALSIYNQDFRFYQVILENTQDENLIITTLQKATELFIESSYLRQYNVERSI